MNVHNNIASATIVPTGGAHPLDRLDHHYLCDRLSVYMPPPAEIVPLMDRARAELPGLAAGEVVRRVALHNPDSFWAIRRRHATDPDAPAAPRGCAAFLMLSEEGIDALIRGSLDATNPPLQFIVRQHERPAAIYFWLLFARGTSPALALVMEKLQTPLYRDVDVLARTATKAGGQFSESLGFRHGIWWDAEFYPRIAHYRRSPPPAGGRPSPLARRLAPPFDQQPDVTPKSPNAITTTVVHGFDDLLKVVAIRSAVYVGEQGCPYEEEFDGNDFSGTHMLACVAGTPVGCLRIRYFAGFAKFERVAVLEKFRRQGVARQLVSGALAFCAEKGFDRVYAHAQSRLLPFWERLGFRALHGACPFVFSDFEYVEIAKEIEFRAEGVSLAAGPYVLIRPEGQWDRPGVLEQSALRPARA